MANSKYEYVKAFEQENYLLPDCYIVIRVDGKGFHKFSQEYQFDKPNDLRALSVMNAAATRIMEAFPDLVMAYGDLDEYSFLLRRECVLYERREMKLITLFSSMMSAHYLMEWNNEFPEKPIQQHKLPIFDARAVVYPLLKHIRDYFSWRQVDCHINNLYNTVFWNLVLKGNMTPKEAENRLIGTLAKDKNEILYSQFNINYNNEPEIFRKGTIILREYHENNNDDDLLLPQLSKKQMDKLQKKRGKSKILVCHVDLIGDEFWTSRPWIK